MIPKRQRLRYCMVPSRRCSRGSTTRVREVPIASGWPGQSAASAAGAVMQASSPKEARKEKQGGDEEYDRRLRYSKASQYPANHETSTAMHSHELIITYRDMNTALIGGLSHMI